jgi:hypothetical protein
MRIMAVLTAALALAACDDTSGPSGSVPLGTLSFNYDGAVSGTFQASGALELEDGRAQGGSFAAAGDNVFFPGQKLTLAAFSPAARNEPTFLALTIPAVEAPASIAIDANCADPNDCARALLFFGVGPDHPHEDLDPKSEHLTCELESGTVQLLPASSDRIRGTVSGDGYCVFDPRTDPYLPFHLRAGSFDVPVWLAYRPAVEIH